MAARMNVVAVEDDPSMGKAIGRLLRAAGYECATFDTAEALLKSVMFDRVDCLITDINLPAMSGLELLEETRRWTQGAVPVIVITAFDKPGLRERSLELGAVA